MLEWGERPGAWLGNPEARCAGIQDTSQRAVERHGRVLGFCIVFVFVAMALAVPASVLWKSGFAAGSGGGGGLCNDGRREGVRAELGGAGVASRDREAEQWERCRRLCGSGARVACFMGGNKRDAARKALEAALGEKKDDFSKWDEEIKKRKESGSGGGGGRGRGWGSGGGGGGGGGGGDASGGGLPAMPSNSWEDAKQMVLAFLGLAALYLVLTQGKSMLAVSVNSALYVLRGFKKSGASSSTTRRQPAMSNPIGDGPGPAESSVMNKWGRD